MSKAVSPLPSQKRLGALPESATLIIQKAKAKSVKRVRRKYDLRATSFNLQTRVKEHISVAHAIF